jgi:hypothetical protein
MVCSLFYLKNSSANSTPKYIEHYLLSLKIAFPFTLPVGVVTGSDQIKSQNGPLNGI